MRHLALLGTVSVLALTLNTATVHAADYIVSNEADLVNAIVLANADGDAASTITLTGDVVLTNPSAIPALGKPLTINTNGFMLSGEDGNSPGTSVAFATPLPGGALTIAAGSEIRGGAQAIGPGARWHDDHQ